MVNGYTDLGGITQRDNVVAVGVWFWASALGAMPQLHGAIRPVDGPTSRFNLSIVVLVARSLTAVSIYRASSDTPIGVAPLAKGASSTPLVVLQPYSRPSRSSGTNHAPTGQLISNETTLQRVSLVQRTTKTNITSNGQLLQGSAKLQ